MKHLYLIKVAGTVQQIKMNHRDYSVDTAVITKIVTLNQHNRLLLVAPELHQYSSGGG